MRCGLAPTLEKHHHQFQLEKYRLTSLAGFEKGVRILLALENILGWKRLQKDKALDYSVGSGKCFAIAES